MMKSLIIYLVLSFSSFMLHAQQHILKGKITDLQGLPVAGANIYVLNSYDGASSDSNGEFSFSTDLPGKQVLIASIVGYREQKIPVDIDTLNGNFTISLEEEIKRLVDLVITAGVFEASDEKKAVILKPLDIVTTAGATADIPGVLNTLPGTQTVGEKGRLFVRGGEDSETKNYIDGMLVENAYSQSPQNIPSRMRFSPFLFSGTTFSTGGYSAEYGQALSGTLVLKSDDAPVQTQTDISIMSVGGSIAQTKKWQGGSFFGETSYTNLKPYFLLVPQNNDWKKPPASWQNTIMFRQELSATARLKVFYSNDFSRMSISQPSLVNINDRMKINLGNNYHYLNINFTDKAGKNWFIYSGISGTFSGDSSSADIFSKKRIQSNIHLKLTATYDAGTRVGIKLGTDQYFNKYQQNLHYVSSEFNSSGNFNDWISAFFGESDIYFSEKFIGRIGARGEFSVLSSKMVISPRLSLAYKTGIYSQVSLASGMYNQRPLAEYLVYAPDLSDEKALHYILNYQVSKENRTLRIEAYHKQYSRLVRLEKSAGNDPTGYNNSGNGFARGIDFFLRDSKTIRNADYWISYSFIDSKRLYKDYPVKSTPSFISQHNLSIVYKQFFQKLRSQLGITYSFSSGRLFNDPNNDVFNSGQTPAYHDLSMNWSYLIKTNIILHFSCTNLLGTDNIFGYQYSITPNQDGIYERIPVIQGAKRFLFAGLFITLSKEKKTNQIRNL